MAETLNFREAVQRAGVSRQRLNEAIRSGRLPAQCGGGPGRPTMIRLEDLQAWCVSEGLAMPVETSERLGRLHPAAIAGLMTRIEQMSVRMERLEHLDALFGEMARVGHLLEHVLERLERLQALPLAQGPAQPQRDERPTPTRPTAKAALVDRLRAMQAEGLSLQAIADRLNNEGVPTLSGKGHWQKGTIGNLLAQGEKRL
jgi:helix-turn-helix protein/recombinase